jgi:hypothetical protein
VSCCCKSLSETFAICSFFKESNFLYGKFRRNILLPVIIMQSEYLFLFFFLSRLCFAANKRLVYEAVKRAVERDRSTVKVSELSNHGLMEITRKRVCPATVYGYLL